MTPPKHVVGAVDAESDLDIVEIVSAVLAATEVSLSVMGYKNDPTAVAAVLSCAHAHAVAYADLSDEEIASLAASMGPALVEFARMLRERHQQQPTHMTRGTA